MIKRLQALQRDNAGASYAFLGEAWATLSAFVLVLVATLRLTAVEQGFFFTFLTLLQAQVLFELGFGVVLKQFVSHEWVYLRIDKGMVSGDGHAAARVGSLVRMGLRWYTMVGLAFAIFAGVGGYVFFLLTGNAHESVQWAVPWWLLTVSQGLAAMCILPSAVLEGAGCVAVSQRAQLLANLAAGPIAWSALLVGAGLFALPLLVATRAALALALLVLAARPILRLRRCQGVGVSWSQEFWPLQRRIATSWSAGFLMFQSFTPVMFVMRGPVVAGQVGVIVQMFHAVNRLGSAWVTAAGPRMGHLGGLGHFADLRMLVRATVRRSLATAGAIAFAGVVFIAALQATVPDYGERFGNLLVVIVFVSTAVALQGPNVMTTAVRFQKREPFVLTSWATMIVVLAANLVLGYAVGALGMALGFAAIVLAVLLPMVIRIYRRTMHEMEKKVSA